MACFSRDITERRQAEEAIRQSEAWLSTVLEASPSGIFVTRLEDGLFREVNPAYLRIIGYDRQEVLGRTVGDLGIWIDPRQREQVVGALRERGRLDDQEIQLQRKSGELVSVLFSALTIDRNGETCILGTMIDITDRKEAEERLRLAKVEWERTFDAVPDMIAVLDRQHRIVRANKAMADALATTPASCAGLKCYECVHGTTEPPEFCPHARSIADGCEHVEEIHEPRLDADLLVSTTPLRDECGKVTGSVHVARDITQRKRSEEALRESERRLRRAQEMAHLGSWELDLVADRLTWSDEVYRIFGMEPQEFVPTYEAFLAAVHPDDRQAVDEAYSQSLIEGRDRL